MKKVLFFLLSVLLITSISQAQVYTAGSQPESKFSITVSGGGLMPIASFSTDAEPGGKVGFSGQYQLNPDWSLGLDVSWTQLSYQYVNGDLYYVNGVAISRYNIASLRVEKKLQDQDYAKLIECNVTVAINVDAKNKHKLSNAQFHKRYFYKTNQRNVKN